MSAYRFCRTDDIGLLVDALNRCWTPYFPGEPPATPDAFKRLIRDLQVWCSSSMVAFEGSDPIGVLIGAKRPSGTLIYRIAVHPDHLRRGHGRHMLESLGSKLAILGPPRLVAEVPDALTPACGLFRASGYVQEAVLTDYVLDPERSFEPISSGVHFVIPVTVDDLAANGLLGEGPPSPVASVEQGVPAVCWERSVETLTARKDEIAGLAVASEDRIEAYVLYGPGGFAPPDPPSPSPEILAVRSFIEDGGARLGHLVDRLRAQGLTTLRLPKVHPAEIPRELLSTLGFRPANAHRLYRALARAG